MISKMREYTQTEIEKLESDVAFLTKQCIEEARLKRNYMETPTRAQADGTRLALENQALRHTIHILTKDPNDKD